MKEKVLLLGNGINNIDRNNSWSNLIDSIITHIGANGKIINKDKPFPLLYEEIYVEAIKNKGFNELEIKEYIAYNMRSLNPNVIHKNILNTGITDILTTNYDLTLESHLTDNIENLRNEGFVKESTYSIFRNFRIGNTNIWHIHGDCNYPKSITLGYEHYSGYLQQMRNYVTTGTGDSYKDIKLEPLTKRLKNKLYQNYSWLDFFFTKDIYILGLTLDFIEIHLWWLLTFRQRAILTKKLDLNNRIVYFYPDTLIDKINNKLQLLNSIGVITVPCKMDLNRKLTYYQEAMEYIKNN